MAAIDRDGRLESLPQPSGDNDTTARIMTNLLTFSHQQHKRRESMTGSTGSLPTVNPNYAKVSLLTHRSTVFIDAPTDPVFARRKVAEEYVFGCNGESVSAVCEANAKIAHEHGQWNHERVWRILRGLFPPSATNGAGPTKVARRILDSL
jgi:WD repeat-containing protein 59